MLQLLNDLADRIEAEVNNLTPQMVVEALNEFARREAEAEEARASKLVFGDIAFDKREKLIVKDYKLFASYKDILAHYTVTKIAICHYNRINIDNPRHLFVIYLSKFHADAKRYKSDMIQTFDKLRQIYPMLTYREMHKLSLSELVGKYIGCTLAI